MIKLFVRDRPRLLRYVRIVRAILMLGPAHQPLLRLCQRYNKPNDLAEACPLFMEVDINQIVSRIEETGYAYIGHLPDEYTSEILSYCKANNDHSCWDPHTTCDALNRISRNSTILNVTRKYLAAEPKLWLSQLRWTFPSKSIARSRSAAEYNFHDFHYDTHDFKSLTIFIYLTDVDAESGPHIYIRGTHKKKTLRQIVKMSLTDSDALRLYGEKIQSVLGAKGTVFAVDTSGYHKAAICKTRSRLIASLDFVIRKKTPAQAERRYS